MPTSEYNTPRWHKDGGYFKSDEEFYKFVFPIRGRPTRFAKVIDGKQDQYKELERETAINNSKFYKKEREISQEEFEKEDTKIRQELMLVVEEIQSPGNEQAALYTVNNRLVPK